MHSGFVDPLPLQFPLLANKNGEEEKGGKGGIYMKTRATNAKIPKLPMVNCIVINVVNKKVGFRKQNICDRSNSNTLAPCGTRDSRFARSRCLWLIGLVGLKPRVFTIFDVVL